MPAVPFDRWTGYLCKPKPRRVSRALGDKMHEIAMRSPKHVAAFDVMADLVLAELNAKDANPYQS